MTHQTLERISRIKACLIGGAIGDALGAPVEFLKLSEIQAQFGPQGLTDFAEAYGRKGAITDDTQMTLFTAEGVIRILSSSEDDSLSYGSSVLHHAYLRWLLTQGLESQAFTKDDEWPDGWLIQDSRLFSERAPGGTCLSALSRTRSLGKRASNNSKGCGTVMRVAPIGLVFEPHVAYELAADSSALTHGHPTGIIAGGAFASLIAYLMQGEGSLKDAVLATLAFLEDIPDAEETIESIHTALSLAEAGAPSAEKVECLGAGWIAEEALAIALYCTLVSSSFQEGVLLATNHSGDSDSTASMAGQLLGLIYGLEALPAKWKSQLEMLDLIETLSEDLAYALRPGGPNPSFLARYPSW